MATMRPTQQLCYTDTGGTFTDTFVVDASGGFTVAKAPSTPDDISRGYFDSLAAAADQLDLTTDGLCRQLSVVGFGSTVVLNTLLTRRGVQVGLIITRGFEHMLLMERGVQTFIDYDISNRIHPRTHRHNEPLVPRRLIRGVTERIDCFGKPLIPLYTHEVDQAAQELLAQGVDALVVCFLFSWMNPEHERAASALIQRVCRDARRDVPVFTSVDVSPVMRELPRLNATIVEAYAGPRFRQALGVVKEQLRERGFQGTLQVMQSTGGLAPVDNIRVVETVQSGPVGGLIGTQYIGRLYGLENLISTDMGGTSFDVGLITRGMVSVNREPECARHLLGVPMAEIVSIGAGGGTKAWIDHLTGRLQVGPDSAGAMPGPVCYGLGGTDPTVTDADLALGYLAPDYFLGGRVALDRDRAVQAIRDQIAAPLGIAVEQAAYGIRQLVDIKMRDTIHGMVMAKGVEISEYTLLAFGGAGPSHVEGFTRNLPLAGVAVFPYSAAFSAFGAAAADYEHHYNHATNIVLPPGADDDDKRTCGAKLTELWLELEQKARDQMTREGYAPDQVVLQRQAMVRYGKQLDDLVVASPVQRIASAADWDRLIAAFEDQYERIYTTAAKFPQAGYEILEASVVASVPKVKPRLTAAPAGEQTPPDAARKGARSCWFGEVWLETPIFDWTGLQPENRIAGPAIVENASTTVVIAPGRAARVDPFHTIWLR